MGIELTNRALLVSLQISQWSARKLDKQETADLAAKHNTPSEVARVNKSLLPMSLALTDIHKLTNEIRWWYYRNSLPWGLEGINAITTAGYMDFIKTITAKMVTWRGKAAHFISVYPELKENAKQVLNGMYKEADYPETCDLARKFSIDCQFFPIASEGDWRVEMASEELERLKQDTIKRTEERLAHANDDAWRRVHKVVTHAVEQLDATRPAFRETLVDNAKELCRALTVLNIAGDPNLEAIRSQIEGALANQDYHTLKTDPVVRVEVADKMKEIMSKMGGMYAPAK